MTLVICSRNRPELLRECVGSVLECDPSPAEVVVVDQSDVPNDTLACLASSQEARLRYAWTRAVGLSRSRNTGARIGHHPIVVFTDDDVLAATDWIEILVGSLVAAGTRTVVTGSVPAAEAGVKKRFVPSTRTRSEPACYSAPGFEDVLYGANMALYRADFDEIGGFDEALGPGTSFPAAEDNDLGLRLLRAGFRIQYVPSAVVFHRAWRDDSQYLPLRWRYGTGQGAFYAKHFSLRDPYTLRRLRWDVVRHLLRWPDRMRSEPKLAYGDALYVLGLLYGAARWMMRRSARTSETA